MKYLLLLLLVTTLLVAKSKDSCYSVQLTSFVLKKNSTYDFEKQDYPKYCEMISFTNMNAVRCGCYENYIEVKEEHADLSYFYPDAAIVSTYKYRFKNLTLRKSIKPQVQKKIEKLAIAPVIQTSQMPKEIEEEPKVEEAQELQDKDNFSFLEDMTIQGHLDLKAQAYLVKPDSKHPQNMTASGVLELDYNKDALSIKAKAKAQADYYDFFSDAHNDRSYLRLDELYAKYDFDDDQILAGKNVRFWGALEVRNITDVFNSDELRDDPFESDKLGSWNASYSHFTDSGEISAIVKFYEQEREMSAFPYVYYFFPAKVPILDPNTGTPITPPVPYIYDAKLESESGQMRPSVYLKYSDSTDTEYPLDFAVIFENGYDSQRYYTATPASDFSSISTNENAYLVNKLLTYNTLVVGTTLVKLEATYADVIDNEKIADYYHIGLGVEHTLTQVYKEADLGLLAEYYNYGTLENGKRGDLELFELFQNDLFLGLRYTLNEGNDASVIGGVILDTEYDEQVYYVKYESRVAQTFKLNLDYRYISPSPSDLTAFHLMGRHERLSLELGYYF